MGYVRVKVVSDHEVAFIHQLDGEGKAYAEDVFVTSEVPGRLDWLKTNDGKVGVFNFGFSPVAGDHSSLKFPEALPTISGGSGEDEDEQEAVQPVEEDVQPQEPTSTDPVPAPEPKGEVAPEPETTKVEDTTVQGAQPGPAQ